MKVKLQSFAGLLHFAVLVISTQPSLAAAPQLAFDFGRVMECVDVTPEDMSELYPGEKIIELRMRVSLHLLSGKIDDVEEVRIEIGDRKGHMRVHNFSPGTTLQNHQGNDIEWSRTTEHSNTLGATLGGQLPAPVGKMIANVTPSVSGGRSNREVVTEKQTRLAPKVAVIASGTIGQERGVFFKLRNSPQSTLEGTHEVTVQFRVPEKWRGESIRVCCQATGKEKVLWMRQQATWGHICAPVALYMAGDTKARQAAIQFIDANQRG
jgi:hypothetical protein